MPARARVEVKVNTRAMRPHLERTRRQAAHALSDTLDDVRDDARRRASSRRRTGRMLDSIERTPVVSMASGKGIVGYVLVGEWYGVLQELGTHDHKGRPKSEKVATNRRAKGIVSGVKPGRFMRGAVFSARTGNVLVMHLRRRIDG